MERTIEAEGLTKVYADSVKTVDGGARANTF